MPDVPARIEIMSHFCLSRLLPQPDAWHVVSTSVTSRVEQWAPSGRQHEATFHNVEITPVILKSNPLSWRSSAWNLQRPKGRYWHRLVIPFQKGCSLFGDIFRQKRAFVIFEVQFLAPPQWFWPLWLRSISEQPHWVHSGGSDSRLYWLHPSCIDSVEAMIETACFLPHYPGNSKEYS